MKGSPVRSCSANRRRSRRQAAGAGIRLDGIEIVTPGTSDKLDEYTEAYVEGRDLNPQGRPADGQAAALLRRA